MNYTYTTQAEVRAAFWEAHPHLTRRGRQSQNDYSCDTRVAFVDFVDSLSKDGLISGKLAHRVTLG